MKNQKKSKVEESLDSIRRFEAFYLISMLAKL
jgi:hypothetical protein